MISQYACLPPPANLTLGPSRAELFVREAWLERGQPTAPPIMLPDEFSFLNEYLKDLSET